MNKIKNCFIILLVITLCTGCSKKEEKLNIPEWMFGEHLSETTARSVLGSPSDIETTDFSITYFWSDYEICPGYKGTLSFQNIIDESEHFKDRWIWNMPCDEKTFQKLNDNIIEQLGSPTHQSKDGLSENFNAEKLGFDKSINDDRNFSCAYKEGIVTIAWRREGLF